MKLSMRDHLLFDLGTWLEHVHSGPRPRLRHAVEYNFFQENKILFMFGLIDLRFHRDHHLVYGTDGTVKLKKQPILDSVLFNITNSGRKGDYNLQTRTSLKI